MALRRYHNDLIPFPGPNRTNVFYPNVYRDYRTHPYDRGRLDIRSRHVRDDREYRQRRPEDLLDPSIEDHGDLGWPLDFATAWCYKFIIGNQTHVTDVIDKIRDLDDVEEKTPYLIFDLLDKALFDGKLKGMVHLRWKSLASCTCGRTSAPGTVTGIARICIDLNSTLFDEDEEDGDGDIDELLDALIHQMIHAFFLVCCGAQPKGAKPDGRLADGLHFGVLLMTVREVTRRCKDGPLALIFYADTRLKLKGNRQGQGSPRHRRDRSWLAIDPRGSGITAPPQDGQSHCDHDNRRIRAADLKNWQVEKCALALDLESSERGDVIYNFEDDGHLVPTDRLKGPPSSTYVELIWTDKRIMITREKSLKFQSLKKPIERQGKMELKVPDCSLHVLRCVYLFLQDGHYWVDPAETMMKHGHRYGRAKGPPVLVQPSGIATSAICGMLNHIKVFKTAESMKFEELQAYALKRLYDMPATSDDPIETLKELYNDGKDKGKPIHAELHKWARKFLTRSDDMIPAYEYYTQGLGNAFRGTSNYEKIAQLCGPRFVDLYHRNMALKDDCKLVWAELSVGEMSDQTLPGTWGYPSEHMVPGVSGARGSILPRRNSWSTFNTIDWPMVTPLGSTPASVSTESLHDIGLGSTHPRQLLDYAGPSHFGPSVSFDDCKRNGDLKTLTGERDTILPTSDNGKGIDLTV